MRSVKIDTIVHYRGFPSSACYFIYSCLSAIVMEQRRALKSEGEREPARNEIKRQLVSIGGEHKKVINWWLEGTSIQIMNVRHRTERNAQYKFGTDVLTIHRARPARKVSNAAGRFSFIYDLKILFSTRIKRRTGERERQKERLNYCLINGI